MTIHLSSPLTRGILSMLLCTSLSGCGDLYRYLNSGEVGWAIKHEVRNRQKAEISLAMLTRFRWDELVVFGSYTPRDEICRRLQLDEPACTAANLPEPLNDGLSLLVFRRNGKIVHREIHLGYHGEFRVDDRISFTPQNAVFLVEPHGMLRHGERHLLLKWRPPPSPNTSLSSSTP
jgi:hypothetical protein